MSAHQYIGKAIANEMIHSNRTPELCATCFFSIKISFSTPTYWKCELLKNYVESSKCEVVDFLKYLLEGI